MSAVREIGTTWDSIAGDSICKLNFRPFYSKGIDEFGFGTIEIEIWIGLLLPNLAPSMACAASAHAIGDAVRRIRNGAADLMLAGGSEASIEPLGLAGFVVSEPCQRCSTIRFATRSIETL